MVEGGDVIRLCCSSGDASVVRGGETSGDTGADAVADTPYLGRKTPFSNVASDLGKRKETGWR